MSVQDQREARKKQEVAMDRYEFHEENAHYPMLHSGFTESCTDDPSKSAFLLSIWFANGSYRCKLVDRQGKEKAFLDAGLLVDVFAKLESGLHDLSLDWQQDNFSRNGKSGT